MKKTLLFGLFLLLFLIPVLASAAGNPTEGQPLVPCNGADCTIEKLFEMIGRVYNFIVWNIATPLATLALLVGGIMILVSAGNPGLATKGRQILLVTVIGLVLVFCAWLIINFILTAIGAPGL
jgi:hypothetical protein